MGPTSLARLFERIRRLWPRYWSLWLVAGVLSLYYFAQDGIPRGTTTVALGIAILLSGLWFLRLVADIIKPRQYVGRRTATPATPVQWSRLVLAGTVWTALTVWGLFTLETWIVSVLLIQALAFALLDLLVRLLLNRTPPSKSPHPSRRQR